MSTAEAVAELRRCAGTQFDPRVVAILCDLVERDAATRVETAAPVPVPA
jgi:HD-GYP domain-containing protein (c-di-GMP phosphodiesterase class II)